MTRQLSHGDAGLRHPPRACGRRTVPQSWLRIGRRLRSGALSIRSRCSQAQLFECHLAGAWALGQEERAFAKALDLADFVHWWHRNPDRKGFSVRIVRGEHKNYFYPDFVVCLEHFPGDEPLMGSSQKTENKAR